MSQTLSLYRLQQVDSHIDRTQARLDVINNTLEDVSPLLRSKESVDSILSANHSAESTLLQAELDAKNQRIKLEQTEASLYNDKGHSPKELLDLQNDVAALKRHLLTLEDLQLEAMMAAETSVTNLQIAQTEYTIAQKRFDEQALILREEQNGLFKELERFFSERSAIANPIPPEMLTRYDQLRLERRGIAVAVISENSCSACGSGLSPAQMQSSRASGQIALCPSCGRILYGS